MSNILFIPNTIKVGYQKRTDTYTNKLAYVIYYDEKNKLRKEKSWTGWCDAKLGSNDFSNEPISGFILNRNGGGTRDYYYWNARAEFVRIWDPRGFEFEISIPNLLFILSEVGCTPGKGLEGEFVYGWNGADLVLLPVKSQDYQKSMEFTNKQSIKIDRKIMVIGGTYTLKKDKELTPYIYLGKINHMVVGSGKFSKNQLKDVFAYKDTYHKKYVFTSKNLSDLGECLSDQCDDNYADLMVQYEDSIFNLTYQGFETILIGKGFSNKYYNLVKDTSKLTRCDDKQQEKIKNLFFKYDSRHNYIDDCYLVTDNGVENNYKLLSSYRYNYRSEDISGNNVDHYELFVTLNNKKYKLKDIIKFFDYNIDTKKISSFERLALPQ